MIGRTLGNYRVTAAIGEGGMGVVYRATDMTLGRDVAIKVLPADVEHDADRLARFEREARLLASLNHPHIAHVYGFEASSIDTGRPMHFLAMELVEGDDLAQRLAHGPIPLDDALAIARQIAEALEAAHEKGIVHRDLKPANVKVTPDGTVKVLDFGLAKAPRSEGEGAADVSQSPTILHTGTSAGMILGTAAYMSPEQARGRVVDKRTDVWAFGVVLWEMLSGKRLFGGDTVSDVLAAVLTRDPDWAALPPQLPRPVRDLLRRCLARDPRQRLHDIADARLLLDDATSGVPSDLPVASVGVPNRRHYRLIGLVVILAAAAAAGLGWVVGRGASATLPESRTLSIVLPPNLRWPEECFASVGISPDGRTIALVAEDDVNRRLYLRTMDSPELRRVDGTDGAEGPFFSPDGHWVAFSQQNGLKKLSLAGGQPVNIAPRIFGKGTWSTSGDIYYTSDYNAGLFRVSAAGGAPQELTKPDAAQGELNHGFPELLPGGRALLFTSVRSPLSASRVEALALETGARHVILEHAIEARYVAPGYVAFVRDQTLMVAPFDADALRVTGPPQPARHRVAVYFGVGHADYAVSGNGTLVLIPDVLPPRREVVRLDRAGRAEIVLPAESSYKGPALSPDGHRLALTRSDNGFDVVVYDLQRQSITRLAASPRREFGAVWDRLGTHVFHVVDLPLFQIFESDTSGGGGPKRVLESTQDQFPQDVSPDGQWLLFLQTTAAYRRSVGILPLASPKAARLFDDDEGLSSFATFSPDGRFIAFQSDATGREEVYIRPVAGNARPIPVSGGGGQLPRWARNGELFYWERDLLNAVPIRTTPTLQIGASRPLFRTTRERPSYYDGDYDVSVDGQSIYLTRTPDLLRPRELRVVTDWTSQVATLTASAGRP